MLCYHKFRKTKQGDDKMFDYSELFGAMSKKRMNQYELAKAIGVTPSTLSIKLSGKGEFKQSEMLSICKTLEASANNIGLYFFTEKV